MFTKIEIDGKEVELSANAATPFRFKQVFHKDIFSVFGNEQKAEQEGFETIAQLTYVMAKQAEKADINKLNEEDFIAWLEGFEPMAFANSAEEILNAYMGNTVTSANP
jgi:hypothetical protein